MSKLTVLTSALRQRVRWPRVAEAIALTATAVALLAVLLGAL